MLQKLVWETYRKSSWEDRKNFTDEAERMIQEYGWQQRTVMPYGYAVKVTKIIDDFKDFDICTECSKEYLMVLVNGLADIMNKWEEQEKKPHVNVRIIKTGKVVRILEEDLEMFEGLVEIA